MFRVIGIVAAQRATDRATHIHDAAEHGHERGRLVPARLPEEARESALACGGDARRTNDGLATNNSLT